MPPPPSTRAELTNQLALPFFKDALLNLGWFFVPFGMIVIVGAANAVNLTDGLDGLAIMPVMIAAGTLGVISYVVGNFDFAELPRRPLRARHGRTPDLRRRPVRRRPWLSVVQRPPGRRLHGRHRLASPWAAPLAPSPSAPSTKSCWPSSAASSWSRRSSVIIQVAYYKRTGKRVFLMAPIHHHFEKKGWAEPQIVIRFWIISLILAMIGLATLKVR